MLMYPQIVVFEFHKYFSPLMIIAAEVKMTKDRMQKNSWSYWFDPNEPKCLTKNLFF